MFGAVSPVSGCERWRVACACCVALRARCDCVALAPGANRHCISARRPPCPNVQCKIRGRLSLATNIWSISGTSAAGTGALHMANIDMAKRQVSPVAENLVRTFSTRLASTLEGLAAPKTKEWWTKYLKGEAEFRGVRMGDVRNSVNALVEEMNIKAPHTLIETRLAMYEECCKSRYTEEKLGGFLLLAEHSLSELRDDDVEQLGRPLASGDVADWNSCDWLCVKVIGPFINASGDAGHFQTRAEKVAEWRFADALWQRRAAAVSFVYLASRDPEPYQGFRDLLIKISAANVKDPARFSQTSVGWLLRELSVVEPERVKEFVASHKDEISEEAQKSAYKKLRQGKKRKR